MTTNKTTDVAVLMPLPSIIALGAGAQGVAALTTWGGVTVVESTFDSSFSEMLVSLERDEQSDEAGACLRLIADAASRATAWLHITIDGLGDEPTSLLLVTPEEALVASIRGEVVEWVLGGHDLVARLLRRLLDDATGETLLVTCFDEHTTIAGLRFSNGTVDLSAHTPELLEALTVAAGQGLDVLALRLSSLRIEPSQR